jgi:hypothetical protein
VLHEFVHPLVGALSVAGKHVIGRTAEGRLAIPAERVPWGAKMASQRMLRNAHPRLRHRKPKWVPHHGAQADSGLAQALLWPTHPRLRYTHPQPRLKQQLLTSAD